MTVRPRLYRPRVEWSAAERPPVVSAHALCCRLGLWRAPAHPGGGGGSGSGGGGNSSELPVLHWGGGNSSSGALAAKILPFDLLPGALSGKSRTFFLSRTPPLIDAVLF